MKIVQSFWSCGQTDLLRFSGGWYAPEYHLMGWALSCLQLSQHYKEVTLYADSKGAKMLVDELNLPYTDVVCELDSLNHYHPRLWALPKIATYSRQVKPFLHVDGDVFIWKPFDDALLKGKLIAQNLEIATDHYEGIMRSLEENANFLPCEIIAERKTNNPILAYNAGIFGGSDIAFFQEYTKKAKEFIDKNVVNFSKLNVNAFNIFFEQYLFYCLAKQKHQKVNVLINDVIPDNEYLGFGDFAEIPHQKQYLHLIGTYKRNQSVCQQMADRLRLDHPEYYYRIIALFKDKQLTLKRDYYYFMDRCTEQELVMRSLKLKSGYENKEILMIGKNSGERSVPTTVALSYLVKEAIDENQSSPEPAKNDYSKQIKDINLFEVQLTRTLNDKFSRYSKEYLYGRDLAHAGFHQDIFGNKEISSNKKLVADKLIEVLESKFDWPEIAHEEQGKLKLSAQLAAGPSTYYAAIIPECDANGYSLVSIDELDLMILQALKKPATFDEVLDLVGRAFDEAELEESRMEFEILITGRIKKALSEKIITLI